MKISYAGYFTKKRVIESKSKTLALMYIKKILSEEQQLKIKSVKIVFTKHEIEWYLGFHWLLNCKGNVIIYVPKQYRSLAKMEWLIAHEISHVKQRLERRLNKSLNVTKYRTKNGRFRSYKFISHNFTFENYKGIRFNQPPWETEANLLVTKAMGKNRLNKILKEFR